MFASLPKDLKSHISDLGVQTQVPIDLAAPEETRIECPAHLKFLTIQDRMTR